MAAPITRNRGGVNHHVQTALSLYVLDDRILPATFYVDPALAGLSNGSAATFNAGQPNAVANLRYESTATAYADDAATNPGATYAFSDLRQAIDASELNAGADTILIAQNASPIPLDNTGVTASITGGSVNSITVTQPLTLVGSGQAATIIVPTADTQFDNGTGAVNDPQTAVVRVTDQAGLGASLSVSNLTFDGSGRQLGIGFSIENRASGTFTNTAVRNVVFTPTVSTQGTAILGFLGASLTVAQSLVDGYGRVGIQFGNTGGSVVSSTVTGRGPGALFNSGIDVYGDSTVTVSGNTITNNSGVVDTFVSDGLLVYADPIDAARVPAVTAVGNAFRSNGYGVALGLSNAVDNSTVSPQYNNFMGNSLAILNLSGADVIQAPNNYLGSPSGPRNAASNPTGTGDAVSNRVVFTPFLTGVTPVAAAADPAGYLAAITNVSTAILVDPSQGTRIVNGTARFLVNFTRPVTGFDAADVTALSAGSPTTATVTGSGANYVVTVGGLSSQGAVSVQIPARAAATADGFLTTGSTLTSVFSPAPLNLPPLTRLTAVGADVGGAPTVAVLNTDGSSRFTLTAFDSGFTGGVRTATADFNRDGVEDVVVGTGVGTTTRVRILDGATQAELYSFSPFEAAFTGGIFVAAGDVTGDGVADLVVTPDEGGGPRVIVIRGGDFAQIANFFGIDDPDFRGGARAALGDFNGDGGLDVVVSAGFGGGPRLAMFDGTSLASGTPVKLVSDFFTFEQTLRNGAYVAAGDINGDGLADLVAGGGPSGGPRVFVLDGAGLMAGRGTSSPVLANFFAGDSDSRSGIRVAVKNLNDDGFADVVVGQSIGTTSTAIAYRGGSLSSTLWEADPFGSFTGGVYVG